MIICIREKKIARSCPPHLCLCIIAQNAKPSRHDVVKFVTVTFRYLQKECQTTQCKTLLHIIFYHSLS